MCRQLKDLREKGIFNTSAKVLFDEQNVVISDKGISSLTSFIIFNNNPLLYLTECMPI